MGKTSLTRLVGLLILLGCRQPARPPAAGIDPLDLVPDPTSLGAWRAEEGPVEYTRETLYEYLDGGAERYLTHGFLKLAHVRYQPEQGVPGGVTLDLYDMGSDLGSFGIYCSGRPPHPEVESWCTEGYRRGTVFAAWKGRHYVHGELDDDRPELVAAMNGLMTQLCELLVGEPSRPAVLEALPPEGLVPHSECWVASDLLGHAFLPGGVIATYVVEEAETTLFCSDLASEIGASDALTRLRDHESSTGAFAVDVDVGGLDGLRYSSPGFGAVTVVRAGRFIAGVHGDAPLSAQEILLARLVERLESVSATL